MVPTTDQPKQPLDFPSVTIGVLTALSEEYAACRQVFDPEGKGQQREKRTSAGPLNCWLCSIPAKHGGSHVVAITRLTHMGNTAAAIAANILLQHCERIESLIMCGIAGAVPNPAKPEHHVRLGDIVVSGPKGIVQYDYGKQRDPRPKEGAAPTPPDPFGGLEFRSPIRPPCARLLAAVQRMLADELLMSRSDTREWEAKITLFLEQVGEPKAWKRPASKTDTLVDSPDGQGASTPHPKDGQRRQNCPRVFHGAIGAANIVLADPQRRDALRDRLDIRAVEMEGSGIADAGWVAHVGYLVVRGTCDYCNTTKNDDWHLYAALIAAAYTRTVIEHLHPNPISQPSAISATPFVPPSASALIELPAALQQGVTLMSSSQTKSSAAN